MIYIRNKKVYRYYYNNLKKVEIIILFLDKNNLENGGIVIKYKEGRVVIRRMFLIRKKIFLCVY